MALLIANLDKRIGNAEAWRAAFAAQLPEVEIRSWPEAGDPEESEYRAFMRPDYDELPDFPELKPRLSSSRFCAKPVSRCASCRRRARPRGFSAPAISRRCRRAQ